MSEFELVVMDGHAVISKEAQKVLNRFRKLNLRKKQIEIEYNEIRDALTQAMLANGIKAFDNKSGHYTYIDDTVASTFDTKRFRMDHPDLYEQYTVTKTKKGYLKSEFAE